ncbi:invasin domain 3-containing protein [Thermoanaerobacterium thermosaccharolyticum]|uniref:invasin domain 3-containing protein n=1 Tax=Thermoanaerobacterium thermosaccharolyticum TaxID=1517 RepID=UPI003DA81484
MSYKLRIRRWWNKKFIAKALSVMLVSTSLLAPLQGLADENLNSNLASTVPSNGQTVVRPDTSIEITLKATDELMKELNLNNQDKDKDKKQEKDNNNKQDMDKDKKDSVGVLVSDGQNDFLATENNGNLTASYDVNSNTIKLDVAHSTLSRYTNYNVYLLEKDALNKYEASINSDKHSQSFAKMLEKDSDKHFANYSFKTGSAIGEPRNWNFNADKTGKVLTTDGVTITANAKDDYGDNATSGNLSFVNAVDENGNMLSDVTAQPSEVSLNNGTAQIKVTANNTEKATLNFTTSGQYPEDTTSYKTDIHFVKPVESGSVIKTNITKNSDGTFTVTGNVTLNGSSEANVGVPLEIKNGTLSDNLPVTDSNGTFTTTVTKDNNNAAILSLDSSKVSGVIMPVLGIDPTVHGNQAWTDTGINITSPNTLIQVQSTGTWASNLYAKVGNGTPVLIGANGGYVTGVTGELYLGPNNTTYSDNVDSIITINDPKSIGIYPTLNLVANPTQINADGKSTSTVSGKVLYGQYPLVDGTVNLSATLGTLNTTTPTTNLTGNYSATLTVGTTAGTSTITGTFENLTQSVNITLNQASTILSPSFVRGTNNGVQYSTDGGKTWNTVNLGVFDFKYVYDPVNKAYIGIGNRYLYSSLYRYDWGYYLYGFVLVSKDGIHWTSTELFYPPAQAYQLFAIATDNKGTVVISGGCMNDQDDQTIIFTSNDGGTSWKQTAYGYKQKYSSLPPTGLYIGSILYLQYINNQFVATGGHVVDGFTYYFTSVIGKLYSTDGFSWHF